MQHLHAKGYRVHVDYTDDYTVNVTESFLDENNVRFIILVQEDTKMILVMDRFGYLNQACASRDVFTHTASSFKDFDNLKTLFSVLERSPCEWKGDASSKKASDNSLKNQKADQVVWNHSHLVKVTVQLAKFAPALQQIGL